MHNFRKSLSKLFIDKIRLQFVSIYLNLNDYIVNHVIVSKIMSNVGKKILVMSNKI